MTIDDIQHLQARALNVRRAIIRMSADGGCFIGASLSCADLLVYLYSNFLNISPETVRDPRRDYLFLSKGHDVPALYGTLAELGYMHADRLKRHLKTTDSIYWHPNTDVPGVEFHSGSLGHLLPVAIGAALDIKLTGGPNLVVVITGDGELNEGSNWEALMVAHAHKLDNLIIVVDRNGFQANVPTEELIPLEPLEYKFLAFGCAVETFDGHRFEDMDEAFQAARQRNGRPHALIAETKRGKGLPSLESRADRWFCNFTHAEVESLLLELESRSMAILESGPLMVR